MQSHITVAARLALLALSVSAISLTARAQEAGEGEAWVYGVAAREAAEANAAQADFIDIAAKHQPKNKNGSGNNGGGNTGGGTQLTPVTGSGVLVAIVDTGIDLNHPEFAGRIQSGGKCFGDILFKCSGASAQGADNNGHGTHVAGIVAAANNGTGTTGVAPGASLLPVKVLDATGNGAYADVSSGISYAAQRGAKVINMSLGGPSSYTPMLTALKQAAPKAVIVAAAGNTGNNTTPSYPAAYATQTGVSGAMIIVGSVDANNKISSFSATPGSGGCVQRVCLRDVFLVAPGRNITSTYPDDTYATMSGTSMATPYVSGVAALVYSAAPYLTPKQVVSILFNSAIDLGAKGTDNVYGRGLVNAAGALAPLGKTTIATSGTTTSSYSSSGSVSGSGLAGPLAAGLRSSFAARDAVFFDSYGRDYHTDLTSSVATGGLSLAGAVASTGLCPRAVSAFGEGFAVSALVADEETNAVQTLGFADADTPQVSELVVRANFGEGTAMRFGHHASFAPNVNALDLGASEANDGLFLAASDLASPYLALTDDTDFLSAEFALSETVSLTIAHAAQSADPLAPYEDEVLSLDDTLMLAQSDLGHLRSAENTVAALTWRVAPWALVGVNAGYTQEENSLLGSEESGALALTSGARTASIGVSARVGLGDNWVASAAWSRGSTQASAMENGLFSDMSDIESQAYGFAITKHGVFDEDDSIGFAVSRPLHITGGSALMTLSTGVTEAREIIYTSERVDLTSTTPETDFEAGYTARLDDNMTLQANLVYQQDVNGEAGRDAVAAFAAFSVRW